MLLLIAVVSQKGVAAWSARRFGNTQDFLTQFWLAIRQLPSHVRNLVFLLIAVPFVLPKQMAILVGIGILVYLVGFVLRSDEAYQLRLAMCSPTAKYGIGVLAAAVGLGFVAYRGDSPYLLTVRQKAGEAWQAMVTHDEPEKTAVDTSAEPTDSDSNNDNDTNNGNESRDVPNQTASTASVESPIESAPTFMPVTPVANTETTPSTSEATAAASVAMERLESERNDYYHGLQRFRQLVHGQVLVVPVTSSTSLTHVETTTKQILQQIDAFPAEYAALQEKHQQFYQAATDSNEPLRIVEQAWVREAEADFSNNRPLADLNLALSRRWRNYRAETEALAKQPTTLTTLKSVIEKVDRIRQILQTATSHRLPPTDSPPWELQNAVASLGEHIETLRVDMQGEIELLLAHIERTPERFENPASDSTDQTPSSVRRRVTPQAYFPTADGMTIRHQPTGVIAATLSRNSLPSTTNRRTVAKLQSNEARSLPTRAEYLAQQRSRQPNYVATGTSQVNSSGYQASASSAGRQHRFTSEPDRTDSRAFGRWGDAPDASPPRVIYVGQPRN
ncbi:MAG: hypothetical protein KDA87_03900 [Planctomycetales bacterium]|nr:hypothetical protein [Planctomycetales bacterium]